MRKLLLLLSASTIMLTGCMTEATQKRFTQAQTQALTCQEKVLAFRSAMNKGNVKFTDERNALVYMVVQELARVKASNDLQACDDIIVAMINADREKTQGLIRGGFQVGGVALGIIGLDILVDGVRGSNGGTSGDVWNISGSRVNSKSGNVTGGGSTTVSASGEGLGTGTTFSTGSGQSVGGLEPRTTNANGDVSTLETGSNSGENAPITLPAEPPVEIQPVE
jgi:hypothetical protein